ALAAAEDDHAHDGLEGHAAREADRLDRGDLAGVDVGVEEGRVLGTDDDVRVGDEVEAAAGADAVDGGDDGLPDLGLDGGDLQRVLNGLAGAGADGDAAGGRRLADVDAHTENAL